MTVAFNDCLILSKILEPSLALPDLEDWSAFAPAVQAWHWKRKNLSAVINSLSIALYDLFGADSEFSFIFSRFVVASISSLFPSFPFVSPRTDSSSPSFLLSFFRPQPRGPPIRMLQVLPARRPSRFRTHLPPLRPRSQTSPPLRPLLHGRLLLHLVHVYAPSANCHQGWRYVSLPSSLFLFLARGNRSRVESFFADSFRLRLFRSCELLPLGEEERNPPA